LFATLSDRLADTFKNLRGKGRLSEADIDATAREIRIALLEADVALPVVKEFVAAVRERARGEEVSQALNPAQQIVKIVDEELVNILGGETRRLRYAKSGPTVILLADRLLGRLVDELPDDRQRDVGLEQRDPDLARGRVDVGLGEATLAAEVLEGLGEPVGERGEQVSPRSVLGWSCGAPA
jgi:hypothetical protein